MNATIQSNPSKTSTPGDSLDRPGSVKKTLGLCSWHDPRQCQHKATHYHDIYGTVCGWHAKEIKMQHPRDCIRQLRGPLITQLLAGNLPAEKVSPNK